MNDLRVLLYARVSSAAQKRSSQATGDEPSLGQQTEEMRREATRRGWSVVACLEDVISGSVAVKERTGGALIYEQAASDDFDLLMVYDNDRIGRDEDGVVAKIFRADMRFRGKQLFSVHQPIDPKPPGEYHPYEDDSALWLESVSDTASSVAIRQLRRRTAFGMRNRILEKKLITGTEPTGYRADRYVLPNGRTVLGERRLDEAYAPLVQRIFNEYEAGHSFLKIAGILNSEGLQTPRGHLWSSTTVKGIINNPVYYGAAVYYKDRSIGRPDPRSPRRRRRQHQPMEKWLIVENAHHPAIISKAQWEHCQALKRARGSFGRTYGESTLFSGLMQCGKCGYAMHRNGGWGGGYFSCNRYWRTGKSQCVPNSIKRYEVEANVIAYLADLARKPEIMEKLQLTRIQAGVTRLDQEQRAVQAQLDRTSGRLAKVREAYEAGADTVQEYARRKADLAEQQTRLAQQLAEIERQLTLAGQQQEVQESLLSILEQFAARFKSKPLRLQKLLLREIVQRVVVDDRQIEVRFKDAPFVTSDYERALEIVRLYSEGEQP